MSFSKGFTPWNKGIKIDRSLFPNMGHQIPHTEEAKQKISINRKGKALAQDNGFWRGGVTTEDYRERRKFRVEMQMKIFRRDNFKCLFCEEKTDLQVDHIKSWSQYPNERFVMENCRTLCSKCHYLITFNRPMPSHLKGWGHNLFKKGGEK